MLVELHTKGGNLCSQAKEGSIRCPLIVRPTSEDVVTGQIVQTLKLIDPRHWLSDLLNRGLGTKRFPRQVYRRFKIEPWVGKPPFPRELLKWDEGSTEVDVQITWENPATTIYIEAKYGSKLSASTSNNDGQLPSETSGPPTDPPTSNGGVISKNGKKTNYSGEPTGPTGIGTPTATSRPAGQDSSSVTTSSEPGAIRRKQLTRTIVVFSVYPEDH